MHGRVRAARRGLSAASTASAPSTRGWPRARCSCGRRTTHHGVKVGRVPRTRRFSTAPAPSGCSAATSRSDRRPIEPMQAAGLPVEWLDLGDGAGTLAARLVCGCLVGPALGASRLAMALGATRLRARGRGVRRGRRHYVGRQGRVLWPRDGRPLRALTLAGGGGAGGRPLRARVRPLALVPVCPDVVGSRIRPSRQESFYFGTPPGDTRWLPPRNAGGGSTACSRLYYGIPGERAIAASRCPTTRTAPTGDATGGHRLRHPPEMLAEALSTCALPLPGARGCTTARLGSLSVRTHPDSHFLIDRHPGASNVWLVGGGSGHGFKMGPAIGEYVKDAGARAGGHRDRVPSRPQVGVAAARTSPAAWSRFA